MVNPNSVEGSAQYVRLALPLMSKHGVPATPMNYTVWYNYVCGMNKALKETLDAILGRGEVLTPELNETLYTRFCADQDENVLRELHSDLRRIIKNIFSEVAKLGGDTDRYESIITKCFDRLSPTTSFSEIKEVLGGIIAETRAIRDVGRDVHKKLSEAADELEGLQEELESAKSEAMTDFLTGVANRRAFDEMLPKLANDVSGRHAHLCLLLIDIDHFKRFNDDYGHIVGDEVLRFAAKKIKELVKGRDLVARFGGEEFAVILPHTPYLGAKRVGENIRSAFSESKLIRSETSEPLGRISVSVGVARYQPGEPLEDFVDRCDQALFFAKKSGKDRVATESDVASNTMGGFRPLNKGQVDRSQPIGAT